MLTVNVKNTPYGATGNGTADDTLAVQNAIHAVGTGGGGTVWFPTGRYRVGPLVVAHPRVELRGAGPRYDTGSALLHYAAPPYGNDHLLTVSANGCEVRDLVLDGGGGALRQAGIGPTAGDGANCLAVGGDSFTAERCYVVNSYNKQVVVAAAQGATFRHCVFDAENATIGNNDGLHIYGGVETSADVLVERCSFLRHIRAGVYCDTDVRGVRIVDCWFDNGVPKYPTEQAAVVMQGYCDGLVVRRCTMSRYRTGVWLRAGVKRVRIEQNRFLGMMNTGVSVTTQFFGSTQTGEPRFNHVREQETIGGTTYQVIAREVIIRDNVVRFAEQPASSPPQLVEPQNAGAVQIIGFYGEPVNGAMLLALFDRIVVENLVVLAPENDNLVVPQVLLLGLAQNERVQHLVLDGCETDARVQRIALQIGTTPARGPDRFVLRHNRFAGLRETAALRAQEVLEITENVVARFRVGESSDAPVFTATAPVVLVRDNTFIRKDGRLSFPAYQAAGSGSLSESGNVTVG